MAGSTIRKALGAVKDQTSISIAKVSSNIAPEIDVAVVKATSHEDEPANSKYLREILSLTSFHRPNVAACISAVSRRLAKTRDWIVAVKSLMLVHRLLVDGDGGVQEEIMYATRRGSRLLNMADFKDEAHSSSWDHSAFVRTYALYLDQKLECAIFEKKQKSREDDNNGRGSERSERERGYFSDGDFERDRDRERRYDDERRDGEKKKQQRTPVREMKPERLLERMSKLQQLMDRFLACRPTGKAKSSRMILVALYPIVRESFQLYADVNEVLAVLFDRFRDLDYSGCVKAYEAYASAAKQIDELVGFYDWCKDTGLARSSEFPEVERITDKLLGTLEGFLRDKARDAKSPEIERVKREERVVVAPAEEEEEPAVEDMGTIKALPAPEGYEPKEPVKVPEVEKKKQQPQQKKQAPQGGGGDLVDLREDAMSADDQGNRLALSLFAGSGSTATNGEWEAFPSEGAEPAAVTSAWQTPAAEAGKADWELALVETASNLSRQKAAMAGGFDPLLLDGMYEQGAVRQHVNAQAAGGSSSSVALPMPGSKATQVLALPAPDGTVTTIGNGDPFAASLTVPPPSYVQMAEIEKKQQLVIQEQMLWQQYARDGMQGEVGLNKLSTGYTYVAQSMPYGMPPLNGGGYHTARY